MSYLLRDRIVPRLPRKVQSYLRNYDVLPTFDSAAQGTRLYIINENHWMLFAEADLATLLSNLMKLDLQIPTLICQTTSQRTRGKALTLRG